MLGRHANGFERCTGRSSFHLLDPILVCYLTVVCKDSWAKTPLAFGVRFGLSQFCQDKIEAGADVNESGSEALFVAVQWHNEIAQPDDIIESLLNNGAEVYDRHICEAIATGPLRCFTRILNGRANSIATLKLAYGRHEQVGPLYAAADLQATNYDELMPYLIDKGASINEASGPLGTPLHAAVAKSYSFDPLDHSIHIIELLLERGSDINASGPKGTALDVLLQESVIWYTSEQARSLHVLLDHGATSTILDPDELQDYLRHEVYTNEFSKVKEKIMRAMGARTVESSDSGDDEQPSGPLEAPLAK
jgi:hypothetical protein